MSNIALKLRKHTHLSKFDFRLSDCRGIVLVISIHELHIELVDLGLYRDALSDFEPPLIFHMLGDDAFPSPKGRVFVILTDIDPSLLLCINQHQHPYHV